MGIPFGRWVAIEGLGAEPIIGFVYMDAQAGPSAKGGFASDRELAQRPSHTVRLSPNISVRELSAAELAARALPAKPDWLAIYGPQPDPGAPWHRDPKLSGKLHPQFPDDLQVAVHDGEPRRTRRPPELCWVRITAAIGEHAYRGQLLNQPHHLESVKQGDAIAFIAAVPHPLHVTDAYLAERPDWMITPCDKGGMDECLDPPSVLVRTRFPDAPADTQMMAFTSFCAACGGIQQLQRRRE
jgi:hypothetical protein